MTSIPRRRWFTAPVLVFGSRAPDLAAASKALAPWGIRAVPVDLTDLAALSRPHALVVGSGDVSDVVELMRSHEIVRLRQGVPSLHPANVDTPSSTAPIKREYGPDFVSSLVTARAVILREEIVGCIRLAVSPRFVAREAMVAALRATLGHPVRVLQPRPLLNQARVAEVIGVSREYLCRQLKKARVPLRELVDAALTIDVINARVFERRSWDAIACGVGYQSHAGVRRLLSRAGARIDCQTPDDAENAARRLARGVQVCLEPQVGRRVVRVT